MKLDDYPAQEPLSPVGTEYGRECWQRGEGIDGEEFAFGEDPYQRLLVFRAAGADGRMLLFWHGGGWTSGYKEWMAFMAPAFTRAGVTFVSAAYRLAPSHVYPTGIDDCAGAVRWVLAHIGAHGGDANKLFTGGHSAGGHYAARPAASAAETARCGLPPRVFRGCLPLSGVFDFGPGCGLSMRPRFLGPNAGTDLLASPVRHVDAPAPFLVAYGSKDFPISCRRAMPSSRRCAPWVARRKSSCSPNARTSRRASLVARPTGHGYRAHSISWRATPDPEGRRAWTTFDIASIA